MRPPKFTEGQVAQAVYTWSKSNVDGSSGIGFSAISGLLTQSTDWLHRLQPDAFKLNLDEPGLTEEEAAARYQARANFGAVGRFDVDGVGVIYSKTADGAVDAKGRPQPVVHAIMGRPADLDVAQIGRIRVSFWRSQVTEDELNVQLPDLSLSDLVDAAPQSADCAGEHTGAKEFLRRLRAADGNSVSLELTPAEAKLADIVDAFPPEVHRLIALNPYVVVAGTMYKFDLTVAKLYVPHQEPPGESAWRRAVRMAAARHLFTERASLAGYADTLLSPPMPAVQQRQQETRTTVADVLSEIRTKAMIGTQSMTGPASLQLAERLRRAGYDFVRLPLETADVLRLVLGGVEDMRGISGWAKLLHELSLESLVGIWNDTGVPAFVGFLLMRDLASEWDETMLLHTKSVGDVEPVARVLRLAVSQHKGADNLAILIDHGFGGTEQARGMISHAFATSPHFLFGSVLQRTRLEPVAILDFIRSNFNGWSTYRRLPEQEAKAISEMFKPKFWRRFRELLMNPARFDGRRSR